MTRRNSEAWAVCGILLWSALGCDGPTPTPADAASVAVPIPLPAPDAAVPDAGVSVLQILSALVLHLGGSSEVRRAGGDQWVPLAEGQGLRAGDSVRTSADGEIELSFGMGHIHVHEGSEVTLELLTPRIVRVQVTGHADGDITPSQGEMTLAAAGLDASVDSEGGRISVSSNGRGAGSLAALEGPALLKAGEKEMRLDPGQLVSSRGASGLSKPARIPKQVALKVTWPQKQETNLKSYPLSGRASPGTRVLVRGPAADIEQRPDGTFIARLTLRNGRQRVTVIAIDLLGRRAADARDLILDMDPPGLHVDMQFQ
jgi:hypothetical protein